MKRPMQIIGLINVPNVPRLIQMKNNSLNILINIKESSRTHVPYAINVSENV